MKLRNANDGKRGPGFGSFLSKSVGGGLSKVIGWEGMAQTISSVTPFSVGACTIFDVCCCLFRCCHFQDDSRRVFYVVKTLFSLGNTALIVRAIKGCELRRLKGFSFPVVSPLKRYARTQDQPNDRRLPERVCRPRTSLP